MTPSGIHIMAYLGGKTWIEADPAVGRVCQFTVPEQVNGYFSTPMNIVRWTVLGP